MAKKWLAWIGSAVAVAAVVTGCGGETPEELRTATQSAADALEFVEADEGPCVGDAIFDEVGFETLSKDGYTSETIALDSETSIESILAAHRSESLTERVTDCLDVNQRFRASLESQHLPGGIRCEAEFDRSTEIVDRFISEVASNGTPKAAITIKDTPELRDLIRPCASESDFASVFDLKMGDVLAHEIDAQYDDELRRDSGPCAGDKIVAAVGFEKLNDTGIGIDGARLDLNGLDLDESELESLVGSIGECSDFVERTTDRYRIQEPAFTECIMAKLESTDTWQTALVEDQLGLRSSHRDAIRTEDASLDECLRERIEEAFGDIDTIQRITAYQFGEGLYMGSVAELSSLADYGTTEAEYKCMSYGLFEELGSERVFGLTDRILSAAPESDEMYFAAEELYSALGRAQRKCSGDWLVVATDIVRFGFADETLTCVQDDLGDISRFAELMVADTSPMSEDEFWQYSADFDNFIFLFDEALEDCYDNSEADLHEDYLRWRDNANEAVDASADDDLTSA